MIYFYTTGIIIAKKTGDPVHAMTHPHTALHNAQKYFKLNALEKEMIFKTHVSCNSDSTNA